ISDRRPRRTADRGRADEGVRPTLCLVFSTWCFVRQQSTKHQVQRTTFPGASSPPNVTTPHQATAAAPENSSSETRYPFRPVPTTPSPVPTKPTRRLQSPGFRRVNRESHRSAQSSPKDGATSQTTGPSTLTAKTHNYFRSARVLARSPCAPGPGAFYEAAVILSAMLSVVDVSRPMLVRSP